MSTACRGRKNRRKVEKRVANEGKRRSNRKKNKKEKKVHLQPNNTINRVQKVDKIKTKPHNRK